jgi:hypothetical protein
MHLLYVYLVGYGYMQSDNWLPTYCLSCDTSTLMGLWKHSCVSTNYREKHDLVVLQSHYCRYSFRRCHTSYLTRRGSSCFGDMWPTRKQYLDSLSQFVSPHNQLSLLYIGNAFFIFVDPGKKFVMAILFETRLLCKYSAVCWQGKIICCSVTGHNYCVSFS